MGFALPRYCGADRDRVIFLRGNFYGRDILTRFPATEAMYLLL